MGYNDAVYLLQFIPSSKQGKCSGNLYIQIQKVDAHSMALHNQLPYKRYPFIWEWSHNQHPELVVGIKDNLSSYDSMRLSPQFLLDLKELQTL